VQFDSAYLRKIAYVRCPWAVPDTDHAACMSRLLRQFNRRTIRATNSSLAIEINLDQCPHLRSPKDHFGSFFFRSVCPSPEKFCFCSASASACASLFFSGLIS